MTVKLMEQLGIKVHRNGNKIYISPGKYQFSDYNPEPDWSAAGYWYAMLGAGIQSKILLKELSIKKSFQGDKQIADWFEAFGITTTETAKGLVLERSTDRLPESFEADFTGQPDQAQTFAALCALRQVPAKLTGLQSLRVKETDRIAALAEEITRAGGRVKVGADYLQIFPKLLKPRAALRTYKDHRMAMSFACWAVKFPGFKIENEEVVQKSYPLFWEDLKAFFKY
jgi:3-phosphoshikimate 1-carboxyvinyltransferase